MLYIAADKYGFQTIRAVEKYLVSRDVQFENVGVKSEAQDITLEVMIPAVVNRTREDQKNRGILVCGTGVGVAIGANKFVGIRACLATDAKVAEWGVVYDNCNILCLSGWEFDLQKLNTILHAFFDAHFDDQDSERAKMIKTFDEWR